MKERNISERTILTVLVNIKCVGYMGKCVKSFTKKERAKIIDTLIERNYLTESMEVTNLGSEIVLSNLSLLQH